MLIFSKNKTENTKNDLLKYKCLNRNINKYSYKTS